jgi:hypothetical protein
MLSVTTGINTLRIYGPDKQAKTMTRMASSSAG